MQALIDGGAATYVCVLGEFVNETTWFLFEWCAVCSTERAADHISFKLENKSQLIGTCIMYVS